MMHMKDDTGIDYCSANAETIDRWIDEGWEWGIPISHETFERESKAIGTFC